jgi:hypothetical protein
VHRLQATIDTLRADLTTATAARDSLASRLQQATLRATTAVAAAPVLPLPAHLTATTLHSGSSIGSSSANQNESSSASDTLLAHTSALSQRRHQQQPVATATGSTLYDVESGVVSDDGGSNKGEGYACMHNTAVHALAARFPAAAAAVRRQPRAAWGAVMAEIGFVHLIAFYSVFLSHCAP